MFKCSVKMHLKNFVVRGRELSVFSATLKNNIPLLQVFFAWFFLHGTCISGFQCLVSSSFFSLLQVTFSSHFCPGSVGECLTLSEFTSRV